MPEYIQQCGSCNGTGLYCGFAEPKGTAVVCMDCGGTGWNKRRYTEFSGRKKKSGVHTVQLSRGNFIATGVGPAGQKMSYSEFEAKYPVGTPK